MIKIIQLVLQYVAIASFGGLTIIGIIQKDWNFGVGLNLALVLLYTGKETRKANESNYPGGNPCLYCSAYYLYYDLVPDATTTVSPCSMGYLSSE